MSEWASVCRSPTGAAKMSDVLTDFEWKILEELTHRKRSPWGAAVGQALEVLKGRGLVTYKWGFKITPEGRALLRTKV